VSIAPAPQIGLTIAGNPMRRAASRAAALERTRTWWGVRIPWRSSTCFISSLSRNGRVSCTRSPGTPIASRMRAATIMPGSHRHSTRAIPARLAIARAVSTISISSHRLRTW